MTKSGGFQAEFINTSSDLKSNIVIAHSYFRLLHLGMEKDMNLKLLTTTLGQVWMFAFKVSISQFYPCNMFQEIMMSHSKENNTNRSKLKCTFGITYDQKKAVS